jgi:hypothetical protein
MPISSRSAPRGAGREAAESGVTHSLASGMCAGPCNGNRVPSRGKRPSRGSVGGNSAGLDGWIQGDGRYPARPGHCDYYNESDGSPQDPIPQCLDLRVFREKNLRGLDATLFAMFAASLSRRVAATLIV